MGIGNSKEEEARLAAVIQKLSKIEITQIETVFRELSYQSVDGKRLIKRPTWLDRENFAEKFGLPDFLGEQLFAAFDRDQNEVVDLNEFLAGMALCLHGNVKDKCRLLFKIFDLPHLPEISSHWAFDCTAKGLLLFTSYSQILLDGKSDGSAGISEEELKTVLISSLQSAHGVLTGIIKEDGKGTVEREMKINEVVAKIVKDAFEKCDTSRNGKLEIEEFEHWVHKNPKLINSIFFISCPKPAEAASHYDVITTPEGEVQPGIKDGKTDHETRSLSELFGNQPAFSKDAEGQSFFDSISAPTAPQVLAGSGVPKDPAATAVGITSVGSEAAGFEAVSNEPELSQEIILKHQHKAYQERTLPNQLLLSEERIVSRSSEMSLVSLGQSTGDLSSLDAEAEAADQSSNVLGEGAVSEDRTEETGALEVRESDAKEGGPQPEEGGNIGALINEEKAQPERSASGLRLELDIENRLPEASEARSPWHPLKDPLKPAPVHDENEDDLFHDASDLMHSGPELETGLLKSSGHIESEATEVSLETPLNAVSNINQVESAAFPTVQATQGKEYGDSPKDSNQKSALQNESSFEEIPESSMDDTATQRPSSLVLQDENMTNVDLTPSEHAIGKPTLRQLAEMKEFDKSPSLEDTKSTLPEERLAAWLPSTETRRIMDAVTRGNSVDRARLTCPSVVLEASLGDPVSDLVAKFLGDQEAAKRRMPTADGVTMNDAGLKSLLAAQCWRGAVDWTAKYLTAHGQGVGSGSPTGTINHTPKLLQVWFVRIALLFKLKSFSSAEAELNAFGDFDNPDLYYQYYPSIYMGLKGSMVPFSLRIIRAELPQHNGRPQESLDRIYRLLASVRKILKNLKNGLSEEDEKIDLAEDILRDTIELWRRREIRVLYSLGNCLIGIKEFTLSMKIFTEIIKKQPETKPPIISGVGRLHLQLGDISLAKKYFKKVEQISLGDPKTLSITVMNSVRYWTVSAIGQFPLLDSFRYWTVSAIGQFPLLDSVRYWKVYAIGQCPLLDGVRYWTWGFVALAEGRYSEAFENFQSVTKLDPENSSAYNNAAVALLFQGKVKEASNLLETLIWKSPKGNLHEDVVFNLCTIYELETSRALQKKQKLLDLVCRHCGDGFNVQSLKLS
eukprot:gene7846-13724_t